MQTAVNEPSSNGLQSVMSSFWSAWSGLVSNPSSPAAQGAVVPRWRAHFYHAVTGMEHDVRSDFSESVASPGVVP